MRLRFMMPMAMLLLASPAIAVVIHRAGEERAWPAGAVAVPFEDENGIILFRATLHGVGGREVSGLLILDSGASTLAIGHAVAATLGIADPEEEGSRRLAARPLPSLTVSTETLEQMWPVVSVDDTMLTMGSGREVLGLFPAAAFDDRALVIDYRAREWVLVPTRLTPTGGELRAGVTRGTELGLASRIARSRAALGALIGPNAQVVPVRHDREARVLSVRARVDDGSRGGKAPPLTLVVDTGASSCVLFDDGPWRSGVRTERWPWVHGLRSRTIYGEASGSGTLLPRLELLGGPDSVVGRRVRAMTLGRHGLSDLALASREPLHGLLGRTFFDRYRIAIDYPRELLWLDPLPEQAEREASRAATIGVQLERRFGMLRVEAVASRSPADSADIRIGDEIVVIDGRPARDLERGEAERRLEGEAGSRVDLIVRREGTERALTLVRRRLL